MKDENTYDQAAKELLAKRQILGPILKETVEEFRDLDVETIERECMEEREVGTRYLDPGLTNRSQAEQPSQAGQPSPMDQQPDRITPRSNENAAKGEGLVTFDVFFYAHMPGDAKKRIKLIINLEAQRKDPRYSLTKRAFFYASRLISSQKNRDFVKDDYDGICKVYTIWICFYLPEGEKSSINHYELREFHDYGQHCEPREDYDLVNMTIRLWPALRAARGLRPRKYDHHTHRRGSSQKSSAGISAARIPVPPERRAAKCRTQ